VFIGIVRILQPVFQEN